MRTLRDANLGTREARARLKVRGKPYWRHIEPGLHMGYRKLPGGKPGSWSIRRYVGGRQYAVEVIKGVVADDISAADDRSVLSFSQVQRRALASKPQAAGPLLVAQALENYLAHVAGKGGTEDATLRANALVIPQLGGLKVEGELTSKRIRQWHADMAKVPARIRTPKGEPQKFAEIDHSEEGRRKRRSSANRVLTILKAALNYAWREGHVATDAEWKRVKAFPNTVRARVRFLSIDESRRLANACDPDFRPLVQAGLHTGCRYSELARVTADDFNADNGTLHITQSKSGKPRHVVLTAEGADFFRRVSAGLGSDDLLFRTRTGSPWNRNAHGLYMRTASERARIKPRVIFHHLRHTWASHAVMNGMPLMVVARNLGHATTRMVETHYGHLAPSYVAEKVREHAPKFGFKADRKVAALRG
jgi:integrase